MKQNKLNPIVSIVVPIYDEEENIFPLAEKIFAVTASLRDKFHFETLLVDDGSKDSSPAKMEELRALYPQERIRIIRLLQNGGLSTAMAAGFDNARGEWVITLDADLQNDPADIPMMLDKALEGWDVVAGIRARRNDSFVKRISSKIANFIRNTLTHEDIRDTGCSLKVYRRHYLQKIKMFTGMHRFLPTLLKLEGAKVLQVEVNHHPRFAGTAKYHLFNRLIGPLLDLFAVVWMQRRHIAYRKEER